MFLIVNIVLILLIFRALFSSKVLGQLMSYRWRFLLGVQHVFFLIVFILIIYFTENYFLDSPDLIWCIVFNIVFNTVVYFYTYNYLVPRFYLANKYPEFILYALICFLISSLFRILSEPAMFTFTKVESSDTVFLYNVYITQAIVVLVASFLGITKDKFRIEKNVDELGEKNEQLYIELIKSKLSPHFLLNTLNNIYVKSFSSSESTSSSILQLSKLLQYVIYDSGKEKISLNQEFLSIYSLTELYQLKYNNKLNVVFDIKNEDYFDDIEIPPSVFLTLFENSLKHSAIGLEPSAFIKVYFKIENYQMLLEIENSIVQNKNYTIDLGYQGLGNDAIVGILNKYYPENYKLVSELTDEKKYKITLKINING